MFRSYFFIFPFFFYLTARFSVGSLQHLYQLAIQLGEQQPKAPMDPFAAIYVTVALCLRHIVKARSFFFLPALALFSL